MIKSNLKQGTIVVSDFNKYVIYFTKENIQITQVKTKNRIILNSTNISMVSIFQQMEIIAYANLEMQFVIYSLIHRKKMIIDKTQGRVIKIKFILGGEIMMTLDRRGNFDQYLGYNKLFKTIKGNSWEDQRYSDFIYSDKNKLLVLALRNGELHFKGPQPLGTVFIHTPFSTLTLSPDESMFSAQCRRQIFIYQIRTSKRSYIPLVAPLSHSWICQNTIVVIDQKQQTYQKILQIWDVKKQQIIKQTQISEYCKQLTGSMQNIRVISITPAQIAQQQGDLIQLLQLSYFFQKQIQFKTS